MSWKKISEKRYGKNKSRENDKDRTLRRPGKQGLEDQILDFKYNIAEVTDFITITVEKIPEMQVFPDLIPGDLRKLLSESPPEQKETMVTCLEFFEKHILPITLHWKHPNFYAYFPGGNGFPNIIGDMLSTAIGGVGFSWTAQPSLTELENIMMDWMQEALNLPKFFSNKLTNGKGGGCIQNTASDAIFSSIIAARHAALVDEGVYSYDKSGNMITHQHPGGRLAKFVCYVNQEAHSCVIKGAQIALCTIRVLKPNNRDSIDGAILEKQIKEDIANQWIPFYCCASLGTTGGCAFDDLTTIGPVCQKYGIYLHVDAAYGGNAFICPEFRFLKSGLKYANSMEINPYKFLMGSIDCSCMFIKNVKNYKRVYQINATYMYDEFQNEKEKDPLFKQYEIDYRHYGLPLSRRMRSLKLYCLLRNYGLKGLQIYVRNAVKCAKHFETLVRGDSRFEVTNDVYLALVCFRQLPTKGARSAKLGELSFTDKQNSNLLLRINKSRKIHLVPGTLKGNYVIRFSVNYEHATIDMMNEAWNTIQSNYVTDLDQDFTRSADDIRRTAQFSFLKPLSKQAYKAYLARRYFTIPMTFGPIIVPGDDEHIANLLSLKRQNPIKLALNRKAILPKSISTTTTTDESTITTGLDLKSMKNVEKMLPKDSKGKSTKDDNNEDDAENTFLLSRILKDNDSSDQFGITASDDNESSVIKSSSKRLTVEGNTEDSNSDLF